MKITSIPELFAAGLPSVVMDDICKRITDWLMSGGKATDEYVLRQFRYAERVINFKGDLM